MKLHRRRGGNRPGALRLGLRPALLGIVAAGLAFGAPAGAGASAVQRAAASTTSSGPIVGLAGKCLAAEGSGAANGTQIVLWACTGAAAQQWSLRDNVVTAVGLDGKCLDVSGGSTKNGAKIQLWTCNGTAAQHWTLDSGRFIGPGGKCLDVTGASSVNGTKVELWGCTGAASQHWSMVGGACVGAANTPGGPDPWGGCWPGDMNTGVPAGTTLVNVDTGDVNPPSPALPADNRGWEYSRSAGYIVVTAASAVIDGISDKNGISVPKGHSLTVRSSATGLINDEGTSLIVENSTINGGDQVKYATIEGGSDITVLDSDLYGGEHEILCDGGCTVRDSWLHNNADGRSVGAHQNGFFSDGGANYTLEHNSVYCTGGCTSDIAFLNGGATSDARVQSNLLVASADAAYCAYPGPDSSTVKNPVSGMIWMDNVFQRGANGKCATYGPVYGWYPQPGAGDIWSGNAWDDGAPLNE